MLFLPTEITPVAVLALEQLAPGVTLHRPRQWFDSSEAVPLIREARRVLGLDRPATTQGGVPA
jgi:hypothetical protein